MPELRLGLVVLALVSIVGAHELLALPLSPVALGLCLAGISDVAGLAGFAAARAWRLRRLAYFGVRATTPRWLWLAVLWGVATLAFKALSITALLPLGEALPGDNAAYARVAEGGVAAVILGTLILAVLVPLGRSFCFAAS